VSARPWARDLLKATCVVNKDRKSSTFVQRLVSNVKFHALVALSHLQQLLTVYANTTGKKSQEGLD